MVKEVEELIIENENWIKYQELYYYLKSSIQYAEGIIGNFNNQFNIEQLLIIISELEKKERNLMYPFIGTWNHRLIELAGNKFENLIEFKKLIVAQLNNWILPDTYDPEYYSGFSRFQSEVGSLIRVFTLNYDLCFEEEVSKNSTIADGFDGSNLWSHSNFENVEDNFCLYKLHGSINWKPMNSTIEKIKHAGGNKKPELIFGVEAKLQSKDPYLFYIYQFRRFMIEPEIPSKLLVIIGYSFSDKHINDIILQALKLDPNKKVLIISPFSNATDKADIEEDRNKKKENVRALLLLSENEVNQLEFLNMGAKEFLNKSLSVDTLSLFITPDDNSPF